jgi:hypothetical protein
MEHSPQDAQPPLIYLNNAATTWPKPTEVLEEVAACLRQLLHEGFLKFLENFGTVRFLEQLRKPYFSFEKEHFISIKGFVGDSNVEVRYKKEFQDLVGDYFHLLLYYYDQGERGISALKGNEDSIRDKMKIRLRPLPGNGT